MVAIESVTRIEYDNQSGEYTLFVHDREVAKSTNRSELENRQRMVEAQNSY